MANYTNLWQPKKSIVQLFNYQPQKNEQSLKKWRPAHLLVSGAVPYSILLCAFMLVTNVWRIGSMGDEVVMNLLIPSTYHESCLTE